MNPLQIYVHALREGKEPSLTEEQLQWIAARYPFFPLPFATAAAQTTDPEQRKHLLERVALVAEDRDMLFRLIDPEGEEFGSFYPDEGAVPTPDTESAIDTFLNNYGKMDPREEALLERLIFNPVPDYAAVLEKKAREDEAAPEPLSEQDRMLDAFVASQPGGGTDASLAVDEPAVPVHHTPRPHAPKPEAPVRADSSLSESLAKIYIRQGRFDKAYEIISQLNLNFPEKSVYFAHQLRFLRKLIRNRQLLDSQKN